MEKSRNHSLRTVIFHAHFFSKNNLDVIVLLFVRATSYTKSPSYFRYDYLNPNLGNYGYGNLNPNYGYPQLSQQGM